MHAHVINNNGSSNNLPCYPPDSDQCDNVVYWGTRGQQRSKLSLLISETVLTHINKCILTALERSRQSLSCKLSLLLSVANIDFSQ